MKRFILLYLFLFFVSSKFIVAQNLSDSLSLMRFENTLDTVVERESFRKDSILLLGKDSLISSLKDTTKNVRNKNFFKNKMDVKEGDFIVDSSLLVKCIYNSIYEVKRLSVDTALSFFHNYSPLYQDLHKIYATLGNIGLAAHSLVFELKKSLNLFSLGSDAFAPYMFSTKNFVWYDLVRSYTDINYIVGSKKEHFFDVIHAQNIGKFVSTSLEYRLMNSPGKFVKQGVENASFNLNFRIKSRMFRYLANFAYVHNRIRVRENGGIVDKNDFDKKWDYNTAVAFSSSQTNNNKKSNIYYLDHSLAFGKYYLEDTIHQRYKHGVGYLGHQFCFDRNWSIYYDNNPTSGYYLTVFKDTLNTYDSLYNKKVENTFYWSNYRSDSYTRKFNYRIAFSYQFVDVSQSAGDSFYRMFNFYDSSYFNSGFETHYLQSSKDLYYNLSPEAFIAIRDFSGFNLSFNSNYVLEGYNQKDFAIESHLEKIFSDSINLYFTFNYTNKEPDWIFKRYTSNHFIWDNSFEKIKTQYISLGSSSSKFKYDIRFKTGQLKNFVSFGENCIPFQYTDNIGFIQLFLYKKFSFFFFDFDSFITYQSFSNNNFIHLPNFVSFHSLYAKLFLFNKALYAQIGTDVTYNSAYYGNRYMPSIRQFYLQNQEKTGNYPYIDFFIDFKIKRARMFFKVEHLNSGLMGNRYYKVIDYPFDGRAFKFGISWKFID